MPTSIIVADCIVHSYYIACNVTASFILNKIGKKLSIYLPSATGTYTGRGGGGQDRDLDEFPIIKLNLRCSDVLFLYKINPRITFINAYP